MAGLDTNVLVRWLVADDEAQTTRVQALFESGHSLGTRYFLPTTMQLELERALHLYRQGQAEFADCLHAGLCAAAGHAPLLSFDTKSARLPEVELVG